MAKQRIPSLIAVILLCGISATSVYAQDPFARESYWPPISSYDEMAAWELGHEISMMLKDLEYFQKRNDVKSQGLANQAKNRLNVLFLLYSQRTGRSLDSVLKMYGYPKDPRP